jgi:hypothetical protein
MNLLVQYLAHTTNLLAQPDQTKQKEGTPARQFALQNTFRQ